VTASSNPVPYNTSTNLTATVSNAVGALMYSWTPTASISGSATTASVTTINITNSTNFIVNITDNGTSCSNNDSIMITYSGGPLTVSPVATPSSVCVGDTASLMAQGSGGSGTLTYTWTSNPSGFTASGENVDAAPSVDTWYIVQATDGANTATDSVFVSVKALPSIVSVTSDSICSGDSALVSIVFSGSAPYTFTGTENGQVFNGASPSDTLNHYLSPTLTTTYVLTSLTDNNGCTISGNLDSITVLVHELPTVIYSASDSICMGESVNAVATFTGTAPFDYIYNGVSVTGVNAMSDTQVLTPTSDSTFVISSVIDANGCSITGSLDSVFVKVNALPMVTYSGSDTICMGESVNAVATFTGTAPFDYIYNGVSITGVNTMSDTQVLTPTSDSTFVISSVVDANGCSIIGNLDSIFVKVNALPGIVSATNDSICFGDSALASIIFTGSAPYTFTGTENGQVFNAASPSDTLNHYLSPTVTTAYVLTSLTDNNGCTISGNLDSITVVVHELPTVAYSGSDTICMGESVNAVATFTGTAPFDYIYNGVTVTGVNAMSDTQVLTPTSDSTFVISSVVDANGCSITGSLDSIFIKVNALPMVDLGNDTTVCINHSIVLDAGAGFASYLWSTGATTQSISLDSLDFNVGDNDYSVMVTNAANCSNSDTITLTVDPCTGILVPELEGANIAVFPNPSKGQFQLKLSGLQNQKYNLEIYNSVGSKVYSEAVDGNGHRF